MALMGMGMANATGNNIAGLFNQAQAMQAQTMQAPQGAPAPAQGGCGQKGNTGKFCINCGKPKPEPAAGWACPSCGTVNQGRFCMDCGAKKPADAPLYRCDKCGWQPPDPHNPPKFCPQCGDPFDDNDRM